MEARDYRERARTALSGNWLISALTVFIASLLGGALTSEGGSIDIDDETVQQLKNIQINEQWQELLITLISIFVPVALISIAVAILVGGTVRLGHAKYLLDQQDGNPLQVGTLFSQFHQFRNGFCLTLLTSIYIFLWSLLFIIPGMIATYRYAMAPFIQAEHPEYSASESIARSKEMMRGHKWELFCLDLSFIGWALLCVFTLGIGNIFLNAYTSAARAAFYREMCLEGTPSTTSTSYEWQTPPHTEE